MFFFYVYHTILKTQEVSLFILLYGVGDHHALLIQLLSTCVYVDIYRISQIHRLSIYTLNMRLYMSEIIVKNVIFLFGSQYGFGSSVEMITICKLVLI